MTRQNTTQRQALLHHSKICIISTHVHTYRLHNSVDKRNPTVDNITVDTKNIILLPVSYVATTKLCTKNTTASNENTYPSNAISSIAIIQMIASVLLSNMIIQNLYWLFNDYHACTYAYDTHIILNTHEITT